MTVDVFTHFNSKIQIKQQKIWSHLTQEIKWYIIEG